MPGFDYSSGSLCLDLVNTWGNRAEPQNDLLTDYGDLLDWSLGAGVLSERERSGLERLAHREATKSAGVFRTALDLRETMFHIFSSTAAGRRPLDREVAALNASLQSVPRQRLCRSGDCCGWEWPTEKLDLRMPLWPVIQSAAELSTSPEVQRVCECGADDCNWLFLDHSPGARRRWCDMSTCGNRAKARRYYERHRRNT